MMRERERERERAVTLSVKSRLNSEILKILSNYEITSIKD